jgi:hypothetical protein
MVGMRSLAGVHGGERFRVRRILFDLLRTHCSRLGIREGDLVRAGGEGETTLLLERPGGGLLPCSRDWARFIQVEDLDDPAGDTAP